MLPRHHNGYTDRNNHIFLKKFLIFKFFEQNLYFRIIIQLFKGVGVGFEKKIHQMMKDGLI